MMKVILTQDVEHLGSAGSVQTVRDGYARNYLLPKKFAILATPGALKQAAERQAAVDRRVAKQESELQGLAERIQGQLIHFTARVGREGRLFGSITEGDIAQRLSERVGEEIDRRRVVLEEPIRSVGERTVTVHLVGRLNPTITVTVEGEGGETEAVGEGGETETAGEDEETAAEAVVEPAAEEEETEEV